MDTQTRKIRYLGILAHLTCRWEQQNRKFSNFCFIRGVLQWWSMRKNILKNTHMINTFDTKIILHNYILY